MAIKTEIFDVGVSSPPNFHKLVVQQVDGGEVRFAIADDKMEFGTTFAQVLQESDGHLRMDIHQHCVGTGLEVKVHNIEG